MVLDERAEPEQVDPVGLTTDNCMRVSDGRRRELERLAAQVECLRFLHVHGTHVHFDVLVASHPPDHFARADANPHGVGAAAVGGGVGGSKKKSNNIRASE